MPASISATARLALSILVLLGCAATGCTNGTPAPVQRGMEASLADALPLKPHVTVKRSTMNTHGQSEFDVFANPIVSSDNASVLYNAITTFQDGDTEYKYMLVDGVMYASSGYAAECVSTGSVSSLNFILAALNEVTEVGGAHVSGSAVTCSSGMLFKIWMGGEAFAVCSSGETGFMVYGSDLDVSVEYLASPVEIWAPPVLSGDDSCEKVATASPVTAPALALLTGQPIPATYARELQSAEDVWLSESSCSCQSKMRPCVFFHGMGETGESTELQDSSSHFGDMEDHAPCCSSIQYALLNTYDFAWTSSSLQQKVCDLAVSVGDFSDSASNVIEDTIVVTHSMGGLMVAGAIANGLCSLGSSSSWVSMSSPLAGSMGVDYFQDVCDGIKLDFLTDILSLFGQCPMNQATMAMPYESASHTSPVLDAAYKAAQSAFRDNVTAVMCSNDYAGLLSLDQARYRVAGSVIPHRSAENDGVVEFQSCAGGLPPDMFGNSYTDGHYVTGLNHADTAFLNGDALLKNGLKPVKWFECLL